MSNKSNKSAKTLKVKRTEDGKTTVNGVVTTPPHGKSANDLALEATEAFLNGAPRVKYIFARHSVKYTENGKRKDNNGAAVLFVNFGGGWILLSEYTRNVRPDLAEYAKPMNKHTIKIARLEVVEKLGGVVSDEMRTAAKEAKKALADLAEKRDNRNREIVAAGKETYQRKARKAAGERFDKLVERYATK